MQVTAGRQVASKPRRSHTHSPCRLVLVESTPQDLPYAASSPAARSLAQAWLQLLDSAQESIHVASYYWSLTGPDIGVNDSSSQPVCTPLLPADPCPPGGAHGQLATRLCGSELWAVRVDPGEGLGPSWWGAHRVGPGWLLTARLAGGGPSAEAAAAPGPERVPGCGHQLPDTGQELH